MSVLSSLFAHGSKHVRFVGCAGPPFKACPFGWTCWSVVRNMSVLLALVAHGSKSSRMRDLITRTSSRLLSSLRSQYWRCAGFTRPGQNIHTTKAANSPAQASRFTSPGQQIDPPRQAYSPALVTQQIFPRRPADRSTCPGQQA